MEYLITFLFTYYILRIINPAYISYFSHIY